MELLASLVRSLAWPMGVVIAVLLLRAKLGELLPLVKRGKVGPGGLEWELFDEGREISSVLEDEGVELEEQLVSVGDPKVDLFGDGAVGDGRASPDDRSPMNTGAEATATAHRERQVIERLARTLPTDLLDPDRNVESEQFARLAEISPTAAALKRYAEMEGTIRETISAARKSSTLEPMPWQHSGRKLGLLTPEDDQALRWLKNARNEIAHGQVELNTGLAFDFAKLAQQVERNVLIRAILRFQREMGQGDQQPDDPPDDASS